MSKKYSNNEFIEKVNQINQTIDLSGFNDINSKTKEFNIKKKTRVNWETVEIIQERDSVKCKKCVENNIKIIYYVESKLKYLLPDNYFSKIFISKTELIENIINNG